MHANKREDINEILAGDICAAVGLKNVSTGDTICDEEHPIALESITFAVPVISVAVEPKTKADQEKMGMALGRLAQEDPTFKVHTDPDSRQTIVSGSVPKEFIKPIDQGIKEAMEGGVLAGYEMVDVKATLYDGSYHDVDSNEMAFKIAGSMAFKEAARKASPVLLEPVMAVEVV